LYGDALKAISTLQIVYPNTAEEFILKIRDAVKSVFTIENDYFNRQFVVKMKSDETNKFVSRATALEGTLENYLKKFEDCAKLQLRQGRYVDDTQFDECINHAPQ
jgi:hypothetical protein